MKIFLKKCLSFIVCKKNKVSYTKGAYWGYNAKVVNLGGYLIFGQKIIIRPGTILFTKENLSKLILDDYVEIGRNSTISARNKVEIKKHVITGPNVFISDSDHKYENIDLPISQQGGESKGEVFIDEGSWIGTNCVIIGNVHIGKHCIIGANTVVTKDIPDYCVAAGVPARIIKRYNFETKEWGRVSE